VTEHEPVPEHAPPQPAKDVPAGAFAVSVTTLFSTNDALQPAPPDELQELIPLGELLTVPAVGPVTLTESANVGNRSNFAPTDEVVVPTVNWHVPVPEHGPVHPAKDDVAESADALRVTTSPAFNDVLVQDPEVAPVVIVQENVAPLVAEPLTEPEPAPGAVIETVVRLNVAVTDSVAVMLTTQAPVPVQAPLQPAKADPAGAFALRVTCVPLK